MFLILNIGFSQAPNRFKMYLFLQIFDDSINNNTNISFGHGFRYKMFFKWGYEL